VITGNATTPFSLGPVVGVPSGSTGMVVSASCGGVCGASPLTPVDVVLVIDRTQSMADNAHDNKYDTTNARNAANALVASYNPAIQWLGLSLLGPTTPTTNCATRLDSSVSDSSMGSGLVPGALGRWVPIGLSGAGSSVSPTYAKVSAGIACYNTGSYTDLADTISEAQYELLNNGRTGVRKGIILMTDGQPNTKTSSGPYSTGYPCNNTALAADDAKSHGIEIFTIGFGLDGSNNPGCDKDTSSSAWHDLTAVQLLVDVASHDAVTGAPAVDGGCPGTSNTDGDHYFCIPKGTGTTPDLSAIFVAAAAQMARGGSKLLQLYPTPVVTSIAPSGGTCHTANSVTISGQFFTGATAVAFGTGLAASFTVNSDTSITATTVAGGAPANTTVDVIVTTPGGTSPTVTADQYTYATSGTTPLKPCG
jgi:hypothetical protein